MTLRTRIEIVVLILTLAGCATLFRAWLAEHDARLRAEASAKQEQLAIADLQKQRDSLARADRQRDATAEATIAQLKAQAAAAKTPEQIARWLPKEIPLPKPLTVRVPPATAQNPSPPAIAAVPEEDLAPLRDFVLQAKTCAVALPAAQADLSSCQEQLRLAGEQLSASERESAAWKRAAKGTFWGRLKRGAKWFAIGAAAGAAAATCASGHCK